MSGHCAWCKTDRPPLTAVGCADGCSRPGPLMEACGRCMDRYRIIPLAEHPDDTDGLPRYRPHP